MLSFRSRELKTGLYWGAMALLPSPHCFRAPINPYRGSIPKVGKKAHFRACVVGGAHPQSGHFRAFTMRGDGESPLFGHGQIQPPATKIVYFANYLLFTTLY